MYKGYASDISDLANDRQGSRAVGKENKEVCHGWHV